MLPCFSLANDAQASRHQGLDGAYFGTTFPQMLFAVYPEHFPEPPDEERYEPTIYGFKLHPSAREEQKKRRMKEKVCGVYFRLLCLFGFDDIYLPSMKLSTYSLSMA